MVLQWKPWFYICALMRLISIVASIGLPEETCDQSVRGTVIQPDAEAFIGAVLSIRDSESKTSGCGDVELSTSTMETYEAIRWAIKRLNQDGGQVGVDTVTDSYVPGIKLGLIVRDSCTRAEIGVHSAIDVLPQITSGDISCISKNDTLFLGFIGETYSSTSAPLASLLKDFEVPQISFAATASSLSDREKYPFFMRTVPPDNHQAKVIVAALQALQWENFAILYSDSSYGVEGFEAIVSEASAIGYCPTVAIKLAEDDSRLGVFQNALDEITSSKVKGVVYFGIPAVALRLLDAAQTIGGAGDLQWIFSDSLGIDAGQLSNLLYSRGIMTVVPSSRRITEFEDHWINLNLENPGPENPWLKEWYMLRNKCKLSITESPPFDTLPICKLKNEALRRREYVQYTYTEAAILSVFAYAKALKTAQTSLCGWGTRGICDSLLQLTSADFYKSYMQELELTFSDEERIASLSSNLVEPYFAAKQLSFSREGNIQEASYDLWNFNDKSGDFRYEKVGSYFNNKLVLDRKNVVVYNADRQVALSAPPSSPCPPTGCSQCVGVLGPSPDSTHLYIPGYILLGGVFPVHRAGMDNLACGQLSPQGVLLSQAFLFAVERIQSAGVFPNGFYLGAIGFDSCSSGLRASNTIINVHGGNERLLTSEGYLIDTSTVAGYVVGDNNELVLDIAEVLNKLNLPSIGYSSSDPLLSDTETFPLFTRTALGSQHQSSALVSVLKQLEFMHVQVVCAGRTGEISAEEFMEQAEEEGICVTNLHVLSEMNNYTSIVNEMIYNSDTSVVMVFGDKNSYRDLLIALKNARTDGNFVLVSDTTWGRDTDLISGYETETANSLTLAYDLPPQSAFSAYLQGLDMKTYRETNTWLGELYQMWFNCYLDENNKNGRPDICTSRSITASPDYKETSKTVFLTLAVEAIARGLAETLEQFCGEDYRVPCSGYLNAGNKTEVLMENIRTVIFEDDRGGIFQFAGSDGDIKTEILRAQQGQYTKVGDYSPSRGVSMDIRALRKEDGTSVTSTCSGTCGQCLSVQRMGMNDHLVIPGDVFVGGLFDLRQNGDHPFVCGAVSMTQSVQFYEAFKMALWSINSGMGPVNLTGVTLGGLAFDDCSSPVRAATVVSNFHSRSLTVVEDGTDVDPNALVTWLTQSSSVSLGVGDALSALGVPQIGIASTASYLKDTNRLATFYNSLSTDEQSVEGIAAMLKYLGWKYVSLVSSPTDRSRSAAKAFEAAARSSSICVLHSFEINDVVTTSSVISDILKSSSEIVVVLADLDDIRSLLRSKSVAGSQAAKLSFISGEAFSPSLGDISEGNEMSAAYMISARINSSPMVAFDDYLAKVYPITDDLGPWFTEFYQATFECNLPGSVMYSVDCQQLDKTSLVNSTKYRQDFLMPNVINSVYAVASALDMVLKELCGSSYIGLCEDFQKSDQVRAMMLEKLAEVDFPGASGEKFTFENRQHQQGYTFFMFDNKGAYTEVATYSSGKLAVTASDLRDHYVSVQTGCGTQCLRCQTVMQNDESFTYRAGDVIFGAIFDVHETGDSPFSCGQIKMSQGFQLLEAFNFAIDHIEKREGIFEGLLLGLTVGGLGLDACGSPTRAGSLLSNVQSGFLQLSENSDGSDNRVTVERIDGYIGAMESETSLQMANILEVLGLPQISYGSSSSEFSDQDKYPNFLRTVPADDKQARALVAVLRRFGLEYVQVVRSSGVYGKSASAAFIKKATSSGICIAQEVIFEDEINDIAIYDNAETAVFDLLKKQTVKVVVVLLNTKSVRPFLETMERTPSARRTFRLIGSETWSDDLALIEGVGDVIADAITLGVETADLTDFDGYLVEETPKFYKNSPWYSEYYEALYRCSLQPDSPRYPTQCTSSDLDLVRAPAYRQDPYVLYTVNAVFAAALGLHNALKTTCGDNYVGLCEAFRNAPNRHELLMNGIKQAKFVDATKQIFEFTSDGESNRGYHIYTIRKGPVDNGQYYYDNVGSYNDTHQLKVASQFNIDWKSDCSEVGSCSECPNVGHTISRYASMPSPHNLNIMAFIDVHEANTDDPWLCGDLGPGYNDMMAFFYAIDFVNNNGLALVPDVKLGGVVVDTCGDPERVKQGVLSQIAGGYYCPLQNEVTSANTVAYMVSGNEAAMAATKLLAPRRVLTVSSGSTSDSLAGSQYYLSTRPTDSLEARVMAEMLRRMGWVYVTIVASEGDRYKAVMEAFLEHSRDPNVNNKACLAREETVLPAGMTMENAKALVRQLDALAGVKLIVMFTSVKDTQLLLEAVWELGKSGRFMFLGGSSWGTNPDIITNLAARGSMTIRADTASSDDFISYIRSMTVADHSPIPDDWFEEFWQTALRCRLENASVVQEQYTRPCSMDGRLTENIIKENDYALHTIIATQQVAIGLSNIVQCQASPEEIMACLQKRSNQGQLIYESVKRADWDSPSAMFNDNPEFEFSFTSRGTGDLGYKIYNIQNINAVPVYREIGSYEDGVLSLEPSDYIAYDALGNAKTKWSSQCLLGNVCNCSSGTGGISGGRVNGDGGGTSNEPKAVVDLNASFSDIWAILVAAFSGLGIMVTLCLFVYLLIFYPNRGGTTALGYILMFGIIFVYAVNFAFILQVNDIICGIRRFALGFVYAMCFSCMLVKVMNTWRIGNYYETFSEPSYQRLSHPCSLVLIALFLMSVQVIIGVEWLILSPPGHVWGTFDGKYLPRCVPEDFHNEELVISCVYVMFLILMTLIVAAMTWNSEQSHQESRWVVIVTCFTIALWIVWGVLSTMLEIRSREPAICICNIVNATGLLLGLFVRKVYLLSKYVKEEESRSRLSSLTGSNMKENPMTYDTIILNEGYDGTLGSIKSGSRNGEAVFRVYDPTAAGADVAY